MKMGLLPRADNHTPFLPFLKEVWESCKSKDGECEWILPSGERKRSEGA